MVTSNEDFQPMSDRPDSYLVGEVVAKGPIFAKPHNDREVYLCDGYTVRVTESVTGVEMFDDERIGDEMYVPFEMMMRDFDNRVEVI
jgi:hypothetical protein